MKQAISFFLIIITVNRFVNAQTCTVTNTPNLGADKTVFVSCFQDVTNLATLFNTSGLTTQWDIPNPATAKIGYHWLVATNSSGCKDTVYINVKQDVKKWLGTVDSNWHNPANWSGNAVPTDKTHVLIFGGTPYPCIISSTDASAASVRVLKNGSYKVKSSRKINVSTACDTLPAYYEAGPKTIVIDNPTSQLIQLVDSLKVVFNGNTTQLQNLDTSNIIVSGIATNAPYGFLRKVKAIQHTGNIYTITTGDIPLETAFKDLFFAYSQQYANSDTLLSRMDSATNPISFSVGLNYQLGPGVNAYGMMQVTPSLTFLIDIENFTLKYAKIEGSYDRITTLGLNVNIVSDFAYSGIIYDKILKIFFIPGTPLIVVPKFNVELGANGSSTIVYNTSITNTYNGSAYLEYKDSIWQKGFTSANKDTSNFTGISGKTKVKLYVKPFIDFKLYNQDNAKGTISAQAYLTTEAKIFPKPSCKLTAGVSAGIGAKLKMFGISFLDADYPELYNYEETLFECFKPKVKTLEISTYPCSRLITAKENVTDSGSSRMIARGICWSRSHEPTPNDFKKEQIIDITNPTRGLGIFSDTLINLRKDSVYYVRAYAVNTTDTAYGDERYFKDSFTTVTIGTQVWMLRNLDVSTYRNGDSIPQVTDYTQFNASTTGACLTTYDSSNCAVYGKLYNWYAVNDPRGLAPLGWHIPVLNEWDILSTYLGGCLVSNSDGACRTVGGKMKEAGITHWASPNTGATNSSGFTGLPYGTGGILSIGTFWSGPNTYSLQTLTAPSFYLRSNIDRLDRDIPAESIKRGKSVRCVKD